MAGDHDEDDAAESPLHALLSVWIERASSRLDVDLDLFAPAADVVRDLWIQWHLPYDGDIDILDVEAMEMLELYARVDYEAAWRFILKTAYRKCFADMVVDQAKYAPKTRVYPRFIIHGVEHLHRKGTFERFAQWLVLPIHPREHSPSYLSARNVLLKQLAGVDGQTSFNRSERIPVKLSIKASRYTHGVEDSFRSLVESIAELAAFVEDPRRHSIVREGPAVRPSRPLFALQAVVADWAEGAVTNETLRAYQAISTTWGICLEHISLASAQFAVGTLCPQTLSNFLRATVLSTDRLRPATTMTLTNRTSIKVFQAACSVLLVSPSLEVVKTTRFRSEVDEHLWWVWLAYAVFSREAVNNVTRLDLDLEGFTNSKMDIVEDVLHAKDPLVYATVSHAELSNEQLNRKPFVVDLRPKSALLVRASPSSKKLVKIETSERIETLRLVDDASENHFVRVLYPGVGICSVDRDAIVARRPLPGTSTRSSHKIKHLSLQMDKFTSLDALVRLVQLVGPGVHKLTIKCLANERLVPNAFLEALLAACPDLSHLELMQVHCADFKWLLDRGLHSLTLDSVETTEAGEYERLCRGVASRRLNFTNLHIQNTDDLFEELEELMFNMLNSNDNLERFFISPDSADYREGAEIEVPAQGEGLEQRHGALLRRSFPLRGKLAFISSMTEKDGESSGHLDASLMAMIFQYAAPHTTRICSAFPLVECR